MWSLLGAHSSQSTPPQGGRGPTSGAERFKALQDAIAKGIPLPVLLAYFGYREGRQGLLSEEQNRGGS